MGKESPNLKKMQVTNCILGRGSFASQHGTYVQKPNQNIWRSQSYATLQNELLKKKKLFLGGGIVFQFYSGKALPIFETFTKKNMGQIEKCPDVFVRRFLIFSFSKPDFRWATFKTLHENPWFNEDSIYRMALWNNPYIYNIIVP